MSSENNKTFADKDFELATEYDVVRLILKNQEFMANFSEYLHPNLFREPLRPIVDVAVKYWKQYGNVIPDVALAQELSFKIGVNLTDEKFKAIDNVVTEVIKQPQAPEYTQKTVSDFIVMQRMENALFDCAEIFEKIVQKKDYDSLPEIVKRINVAGEPIIFHKPAFFIGDLDKRTEIRQKILTGEIVRIGIPTSIPKLDSLLPYKGLERGMMGMFLASTGRGKCFKQGTEILLYDGSIKKVEEVSVGDLLMGDDSTPRKVLSLASGKEMMYEVKPVKGESYVVNKSHILSLKYTKGTNKKHCDNRKIDIPLEEYIGLSKHQKHILKGYRVPVEFTVRQVECDPYILGLWLGDGSSNAHAITNVDPEVIAAWKEYAQQINADIRISVEDSFYITTGNGKNKRHGRNKFLNILKKYNLLCNKHIPLHFKCNSRKNRLRLLAGLIDSDGYKKPDNGIEFSFKSQQLAEDVIFLCRSLGFSCYSSHRIKKCKNSPNPNHEAKYYTFNVYGFGVENIPCNVARKTLSPRKQKKDVLSTGIKSVLPVGEDKYFGFETDGNHRFLLGDFTVVHNSIALKHCSYAAAMLGMKVAFFSLELPEEMLLDRMDSMVSAVPIMDVLNEHNKVREEIKFVAEQVALPNGFGEIIFQELPPLCNAVSISNELNKLEKRYSFKPDIIIVDYMDLMSSVKRFKEGGWREQQEVARELRALTGKQRAVLWTASQANRGAVNIVEEGGVVSDAESAESYSKQSVADFIVSLNQTKAEKALPYDPKPMHLFVVKNRVGPGGIKIGIQTAFSRMCFYAGDYDDAQNKLMDSMNSGAFVEKK